MRLFHADVWELAADFSPTLSDNLIRVIALIYGENATCYEGKNPQPMRRHLGLQRPHHLAYNDSFVKVCKKKRCQKARKARRRNSNVWSQKARILDVILTCEASILCRHPCVKMCLSVYYRSNLTDAKSSVACNMYIYIRHVYKVE